MTVDDEHPSAFMSMMEAEAKALCASCGASFTFLESPVPNAVAIQEPGLNVVAVNGGMFLMFCRLAAHVVRSGAFVNIGNKPSPVWKPDFQRTVQGPRKLLKEGEPFYFIVECADFSDDTDRKNLFQLILKTLFLFVVLHEIGHIANDHGLRQLPAQPSPPLLIDGADAADTVAPDGIHSHARELLADSFAITRLIDRMYEVSLMGQQQKDTRAWYQNAMPTNADLVRTVLLIVELYFRMFDRSYYDGKQLLTRSHPPAPFRMRNVMATLIEHPPLGLTEEETAQIVQQIPVLGDAVTSVAMDIFPNTDWLKMISIEDINAHFLKIHSVFPQWQGKLNR